LLLLSLFHFKISMHRKILTSLNVIILTESMLIFSFNNSSRLTAVNLTSYCLSWDLSALIIIKLGCILLFWVMNVWFKAVIFTIINFFCKCSMNLLFRRTFNVYHCSLRLTVSFFLLLANFTVWFLMIYLRSEA